MRKGAGNDRTHLWSNIYIKIHLSVCVDLTGGF